MFAEDISEDRKYHFPWIWVYFWRYLRNLRGRLLSAERLWEVLPSGFLPLSRFQGMSCPKTLPLGRLSEKLSRINMSRPHVAQVKRNQCRRAHSTFRRDRCLDVTASPLKIDKRPPFDLACAKGIFAKGILGGTGFSLLRWDKGSETPSFPKSEHEERGSLRPFSPPQEGSQTLFSTAKGKTPYLPKSP